MKPVNVDKAAQRLVNWFGYSWEGLKKDGKIGDRGFKCWGWTGDGHKLFQGHQEDVRDIIRAIVGDVLGEGHKERRVTSLTLDHDQPIKLQTIAFRGAALDLTPSGGLYIDDIQELIFRRDNNGISAFIRERAETGDGTVAITPKSSMTTLLPTEAPKHPLALQAQQPQQPQPQQSQAPRPLKDMQD